MDSISQSMLPSLMRNSFAVHNAPLDTTSVEREPIGDIGSTNSAYPQDFTPAERPLVMNRFFRVLTNEENHQILAAIKLALTSTDCDPSVKRKIFENIMNIEKNIPDHLGKVGAVPVDIYYLKAINDLLDEIRAEGNRIILDNTDFTSVNLKNLDLSNSSAVSVKFNSVKMDHIVWENTTFSGARFSNSEIRNSYFAHAVFSASVFMKCSFLGGMLNHVSILKSRFYETNFEHVLVPLLETDDTQLRKKAVGSETCDFSTVPCESTATDHPYFEFFERQRSLQLKSCKGRFAQILNFKHTSCDSQASSVSVLRTSLAIREAIPEFAVHVAELISQYACEDSLWAERPLKSDFNLIVDNEENQIIQSAIKKALVSLDCDPKIKRNIFKNVMNFNKKVKKIAIPAFSLSEREKLGENSYIQTVNKLLDEIREAGNSIILDNVDFTGINLRHFDLSGASAVAAKFNSMELEYVVWRRGNFSKAQFYNVNILRCRFKNSRFNKSIHDRTYIRLSEFTKSEMSGVEFQRVKFDGVLVNGLVTDDPRFHRAIIDHKITRQCLLKTYPNPEIRQKSESAQLILQYVNEENTDTASFLAFEFSTKRHTNRKLAKSRTFGFLKS